MTWGLSLSFEEVLEKVTKFGWLGALTIFSPFLLNKLGIEHKVDYGDSWMRIMSKFLLISNSMSVRNLFFQIFCENTLRFFIIILVYCSQLSKLTHFYFHGALDTFLNATLLLWYAWTVTFFFSFIYFSWFNISILLIFLFFYFYFCWWWRGMWLQSRDMSHNVRS